jgi:3-polyprenyl-4-hydroxybenzoate decarboxylase
MGFDATAKMTGEEVGGHPIRDWPTRMKMSEEMRERIDRRWKEFGLG